MIEEATQEEIDELDLDGYNNPEDSQIFEEVASWKKEMKLDM